MYVIISGLNLCLILLFLNFLPVSCSSSTKQEQTVSNLDAETNHVPDQLNLSIVIDLSDRLTRDNVIPSQKENDITLINYFINYFIDYCKSQKVNKCKNSFRILFYPAPKVSNINNLSKDLYVDLSTKSNNEKLSVLTNMKDNMDEALEIIYSKTLTDKNFTGSDIWDFFANKQVDKLCIKSNYRNVVVILTDGYLYHSDHKIQQGNSYSYVLPQTLQKGGTLIPGRNDLTNIEVIMLEVNPYSQLQKSQLISVLENWFKDMGMNSECLSINETDIPNNTQTIIKNFLNP